MYSYARSKINRSLQCTHLTCTSALQILLMTNSIRVRAIFVALRRAITKEKRVRAFYMQAVDMLRAGIFSHRKIARRCSGFPSLSACTYEPGCNQLNWNKQLQTK